MKYRYVIILISLFLLLSCDTNKEINETKFKENDTQSNIQSETINDVIIQTENVLTDTKINELLNIKYSDLNDSETYSYKTGILAYSIEIPSTRCEENTYYFANDSDDTQASYISVSGSYEIDVLKKFGYSKGMSLKQVKELDPSFEIKEFWTGYDDHYGYYIELEIGNYIYVLSSSDIDDQVWGLYIKRNKENVIENQSNNILELVLKHGQNESIPIFYSKGNINNDNYEDIIITSKVKAVEGDVYEDVGRSTIILFGKEEGYTKYGEVKDLIHSYTGSFGDAIVSVAIKDGEIEITQYGGSAWRNNFHHIYKYDDLSKKIYLSKTENSYYHCSRPMEETLRTISTEYDKDIDILQGFVSNREDNKEYTVKKINESEISYQVLNKSLVKEEQFINETIRKYRNDIIDNIINENYKGEFEISYYNQIKNSNMISIGISIDGNYFDYSKEIIEDKYNAYFNYYKYVNIDLVNLKELDILNDYTLDDITEVLYGVLNKESEANEYNIKTKEDIYKRVEKSLDKMSFNSDFVYKYNDLAIELKLFVHNETLNLVREIETVLLREDDLLIQSLYYKELFD